MPKISLSIEQNVGKKVKTLKDSGPIEIGSDFKSSNQFLNTLSEYQQLSEKHNESASDENVAYIMVYAEDESAESIVLEIENYIEEL